MTNTISLRVNNEISDKCDLLRAAGIKISPLIQEVIEKRILDAYNEVEGNLLETVEKVTSIKSLLTRKEN